MSVDLVEAHIVSEAKARRVASVGEPAKICHIVVIVFLRQMSFPVGKGSVHGCLVHSGFILIPVLFQRA